MAIPISHALVLPDVNYTEWFRAAEPYTRAFDRVIVVRSPAGYDLNRFRNVSAVLAPGVWANDDPVFHIRRAYATVVRIDVIRASTPGELTTMLNERIRRKDRFGETINNGGHIYDRFVISWPSDQRPARIVRSFNVLDEEGRKNEGLDIYALAGSNVRAVTPGTVANVVKTQTGIGYGQYVQIVYTFDGKPHLITYASLKNITVRTGQIVKTGTVIAQAAGPTLKLVIQRPGNGLKNYVLPDVIDPIPLIYWDGLRLRTTVDGLRIRAASEPEHSTRRRGKSTSSILSSRWKHTGTRWKKSAWKTSGCACERRWEFRATPPRGICRRRESSSSTP
jgi:murein DD-endopeptidase MepM/ murein hydrolase activator NlpD